MRTPPASGPPMSLREIAVVVPLLAIALLAGCAGKAARTSLDATWTDPQARGAKFKKVLVISVASDEFAQQYFQEDLAAALRRRGVNAVASERFFTHRSPAEEARFMRAVEASGADAVLLGRVVGSETRSIRAPAGLTQQNGSPAAAAASLHGAFGQAFAPAGPMEGTRTTVMVETVLYELQNRRAIWTARTRTENAEQGDLKPAVAQFVSVLVDAMARDGVF